MGAMDELNSASRRRKVYSIKRAKIKRDSEDIAHGPKDHSIDKAFLPRADMNTQTYKFR